MCVGRDVKITASESNSKSVNHAWQLLDSGIAMDNVMILCRNLASSFVRWKAPTWTAIASQFWGGNCDWKCAPETQRRPKLKSSEYCFSCSLKRVSYTFGGIPDIAGEDGLVCLECCWIFAWPPEPSSSPASSCLECTLYTLPCFFSPYFLLSPLFGQDRPTSPDCSHVLLLFLPFRFLQS